MKLPFPHLIGFPVVARIALIFGILNPMLF